MAHRKGGLTNQDYLSSSQQLNGKEGLREKLIDQD